MTTPENQDDSGLTGSAPLYRRVEPLHPERHAKLGMRRSAAPFAFAAEAHFLSVLVTEFPAAATSYPIIFAGEDKAPLVVMGINSGQNLFFNKDGTARPDTYVPAYIRRYPFIAANKVDGESGIVCLDVDSDLVAEDADLPLFENGQLTAFGQMCVDFCQKFEDDRIRSDQILDQIKALDLLALRAAHHQPRDNDGNAVGEPQIIAEFYAVDENLLNELSGEQLVALRATGALAFIYAHLISQWHWERLINLQILRGGAPQQPPANAA